MAFGEKNKRRLVANSYWQTILLKIMIHMTLGLKSLFTYYGFSIAIDTFL